MADEQVSTKVTFELDEDEVTVYASVMSSAETTEYSEEWFDKQLCSQGF